ncbi:MAG: hypothetical protein KDD11_00360 [Acidobacteria bacterium]|nr:hypothetical protein [Acidobacteriota bacterium]
MARKSSFHIVLSYALSLLITIAVLVVWVVYVVRAQARINELAAGVGVGGGRDTIHWWMLGFGCLLLALVIGGLTYQLAQTLSARRYSAKQDEFVSNITHELKSPLAAIRLHAETLLQTDIDPRERRRFLGYILQQTERMEGLVDNVLESSRLQARKEHLALEPIAVGRFFEDSLDELRERVQSQGFQLKSAIDTDGSILASEDALHRILNNLVDNAARFSSPGGEIRCLVGDGRRGGVTIAIEDDGVGIPKGELRRVFDRFYQIGRQIRGPARGTGLGLAIVAGLVREMGGSIRAVSPEGRPGIRFEIDLPRVEA